MLYSTLYFSNAVNTFKLHLGFCVAVNKPEDQVPRLWRFHNQCQHLRQLLISIQGEATRADCILVCLFTLYVRFEQKLSPNFPILCRTIWGQKTGNGAALFVAQRGKLAEFFHAADSKFFNYTCVVRFYRVYADVERFGYFLAGFSPADH